MPSHVKGYPMATLQTSVDITAITVRIERCTYDAAAFEQLSAALKAEYNCPVVHAELYERAHNDT